MKRTLDCLENWLISGAGQKKYKMSLDPLVPRERGKKEHVKGTQKSAVKSNLGLFKYENNSIGL